LFLEELDLPQIYRSNLDGYLAVLENLKQQIALAQKQIKETCKNSIYTQKLVTIPGISYFSALLIAAEIADINRFRNYKKLCCYAGLVSTTHQSADKVYHGRLIKDSNKYLRYALIEAVSTAVRKDPELWNFYQKISRAKGKNKARVAVARKLLIAIYYMLKNSADYEKNKNYRYLRVNPVVKLGTI
jgi:transposase